MRTVSRGERLLVMALAMAATYAFFCEYLRPLRRMHLGAELERVDYPLQRYAFQAFKERRLPQWDPSIDGGASLVGNPRAALFYPPAWVMRAMRWKSGWLSYSALQLFAFAHVWLGFVSCYLWLRGRSRGRPASALASAAFALGGVLPGIAHGNAAAAVVWAPLGFLAIDQAAARSDWRPLWKLASASALCFLAGHPPAWAAFVFCAVAYTLVSAASRRMLAAVGGALGFSVLLFAVQLLPALGAGSLWNDGKGHAILAMLCTPPLALAAAAGFDRLLSIPVSSLARVCMAVGLVMLLVAAYAVSGAGRTLDPRPGHLDRMPTSSGIAGVDGPPASLRWGAAISLAAGCVLLVFLVRRGIGAAQLRLREVVQVVRRYKRACAAGLALAATGLFFVEYLPPFKHVRLYSDIDGYHYPLQRFAFHAYKDGRFPEWDPSIYCGISFVGNVQAALFYPPSWFMHAASWTRARFSFKALEVFVFAHVWLGFLLCYLWLRGRRLGKLASALGASVFACGGYMMSQCWHTGVASGMVWMPLAFWGVDEAVERCDWRPLWKVTLASAMCFLAGYIPTLIVLCACTFLYALTTRGHWRAAAGALAALAASMPLVMVQLLPALEGASGMVRETKYGGSVEGLAHSFVNFFLPNWFDYNRAPQSVDWGAEYLYLGLPALFAIGWLALHRRWRLCLPAAAVAAFCLVMVSNPYGVIRNLIERIPFLARTTQGFNFFEGIAVMAALVTALGVHDCLTRAPGRRFPRWLAPCASLLLVAWSIRHLWIWSHGGVFPVRFDSLVETAVGLALFSAALWTLYPETGSRRIWLAAVVLAAAGVDFKVHGTSRQFNATDGDLDSWHETGSILGVDKVAYWELQRNRHYRIASTEVGGPHPTDLRLWGLATPQGFDPFLPAQYKKVVERWVPFRTNRLFYVDLKNEAMLQEFGVRYVMTTEPGAERDNLPRDPNFRLVGPRKSWANVYEYIHARPPFRFEDGGGDVRVTGWAAERRAFRVRSEQGGRFVLVEQFMPGWSATVDGKPLAVGRWDGAFQQVRVPPGEHTLVFQFRSLGLRIGAVVSLLALGLLAMVVLADRRADTRFRHLVE
jgi:hypothetical protein